jgi:hypothetical protein
MPEEIRNVRLSSIGDWPVRRRMSLLPSLPDPTTATVAAMHRGITHRVLASGNRN